MQFIRVERKLLEQLTLLAGWLGMRGHEDPYTVLRNSYEEGDWRDSPGRLFPEFTKAGFNSVRHLHFGELLGNALDSLGSASGISEAHLPQLVGTIVELIQNPYGQNVMAGDTLRRLRKAVLFPEELAKVSANAAKELKCGACGKPFQEGEMASFMGGERQPFFACSRCALPNYAACARPGCDCAGEINHRAMSNVTAKADCGTHVAKAEAKVEPIPEEIRQGRDPNPFEGRPDDVWREVGQGQPMPAPPLAVEERERQLRPRRVGDRLRGIGR